MRYLTVLLAVLLTASAASAITGWVEYVDPTPAPPMAPGYVTNIIMVDTGIIDWLSAQLLVTPENGLIYDDMFGAGGQAPTNGFIGLVPTLAWDSFATAGLEIGGDPTPGQELVLGYRPVTLGDGAVDIGGPAAAQWNAAGINQAYWATTDDDYGERMLAQVTLQNTTQGTWAFRATESPAGGPYVDLGGDIVDGKLVPEPATMSLLVLGGLGVLIRRKR